MSSGYSLIGLQQFRRRDKPRSGGGIGHLTQRPRTMWIRKGAWECYGNVRAEQGEC